MHRMIANFKPENINHWIMPLINGNNYSLMKSMATDKEKVSEINNKFSLGFLTIDNFQFSLAA